MKPSHLWCFWLPILVVGLYLARCLYELNPIQFAFLGDPLGTLALSSVILAIAYGVARIGYRSHADRFPPDLSPLLLLAIYVFWPQVDLRLALILLLGAAALIGSNYLLPRHTRWFDLALGVIMFLLYLSTLSSYVGAADTFEFQVVMPQWGIAHPTGYPLLVTIGKLVSFLPLGSMAFRLNLVSAFFATLAVLLIYRIIVLLTSDRLPAAIAALMLAASTVFWSQAIVIEVYALNALLVAMLLLLLVRLLEKDLQPRRQKNLVYVLALVSGLALSHHLDSAIMLAPVALTMVLVRPKLPLQSWLIAAGCLFIGLTPWLFIYLRWPALHNGAWMTTSEWIGWLTGQRFGGALNTALWSDPTRWGIMTRLTLEQFGWLGVVLAVLGLFVLFKRAWRVALIIFVAFAGYFFFGLTYNVPDVDVFVIPAFLCMTVWIGIAISGLVTWVSDKLQAASPITRPSASGSGPVGRSALIMLCSLLPLFAIAGNYSANNQLGLGVEQEAWGRYVLSLPIPPKAALLVDSEKIAPLYYLQVNEKLRPDLDILVMGDEALYRQELDKRINAGQPVYLARFLPNLPYRMRSLGPLVEVSRAPLTSAPAMSQTLHASFGDQFKLLGLTMEQPDPEHVTLYWQATSPERKNYHVRLRLVDANGGVWWEDTGAHPVGGYYPTGAWAQGEIVSDFHEIKVEPFVPAGQYDLEVGLFMPFREESLPVNGANWLKVATVAVSPAQFGPLAHQIRSLYGGERALTSVDEPGDVSPSNDVTLRINATGARDPAHAILTLVSDQGVVTTTSNGTIQMGQSRLEFRAPEQNGTYTLHLGVTQPARCHWLAPLTPDCEIGKLTVADETIGNAFNFENQVLLTNASIDRDMLKPNEAIKVDLTWRGLKAWPDDYTAFVHLIGPDGRVHGQVDQWPVQGTLPTSSWSARQVVNDPYSITLPPDAPGGRYQIEVGWYLLSTLRRLNVLDAAGRASDDHVIVGEFVVP